MSIQVQDPMRQPVHTLVIFPFLLGGFIPTIFPVEMNVRYPSIWVGLGITQLDILGIVFFQSVPQIFFSPPNPFPQLLWGLQSRWVLLVVILKYNGTSQQAPRVLRLASWPPTIMAQLIQPPF